MKITAQQVLVMYDITKSAMNHINGFAGYSKEEIMRLLNDIILQQDNADFLELDKAEVTDIYETGKVEDPDLLKEKGLQDVTHEVLKKISKNTEDFWG